MSLPRRRDYTLADRAMEWLSEVVGFELDEWQELVLRESLAESRPGKWAATEVGLVVPRQNGKGAILEARELIGLFLLGDPLVVHTAHEFKTAQEHFLRLCDRIAPVPELLKRLRGGSIDKGIRRGSGEQGIELASGARLRIIARSRSSARGFTNPLVVFDEAMYLSESSMGSMVFTQATQEGRQRWYTGSAVDQFEHTDGVVFARTRERGIAGADPRLAFFEWSLDVEVPDMIDADEMLDEDMLAAANPGYGIRISREAVEDEFRSVAARTFAVERLGVGDWPPTTLCGEQVIPVDEWNTLSDPRSRLRGEVVLAVDTTPDRSWTTIAAAGLNEDGLPHVEVGEHRRGTGWAPARIAELCASGDVVAVVCGGKGAASSLEPECRDREVALKLLSASDESRAFGLVCDLVSAGRLRHLGSEELRSAIKGATKRRLGDSWAWDRRDAAVDISPLVAASLALWESAEHGWDDEWEPQVF